MSCNDVLERVDVKPRFDRDGAFLYLDQGAKHKRSDQGSQRACTPKKRALRIQTRERCAEMIVCALALHLRQNGRVEMITHVHWGGSPRRVRSDISSLGWVVSRNNVKEETITMMRIALRNATISSTVISITKV